MSRRGARPAEISCRYFATFRTPSATTDGETKPTWANHATNIPCSRRHPGGLERRDGDLVQYAGNEVITFRYRGDITPQMRIRFSTTSGTDDVLEIVDVGDPDGMCMWEVARCNLMEST